MDPLKNLRLRFEQGVVRAYESLTEGWRELLNRSGAALTHFDAAAKQVREGHWDGACEIKNVMKQKRSDKALLARG